MFNGVNPMKLAGLFAKYGQLKVSDLTAELIRDVAITLEFPPPERAVIEPLLDLARTVDQNGNLVAWLQGNAEAVKPLFERVAQVVVPEPVLHVRCPHCRQPHLMSLKGLT